MDQCHFKPQRSRPGRREAALLMGIPIDDVSSEEAAEEACRGGLILAPSAPGLCNVTRDPSYRTALLESDLNLTDSSLALGLIRLLCLGRPRRTSGLAFLRAVLRRAEVRKDAATFWVMPDAASMERHLHWLSSQGLHVTSEDCHLAPIYPEHGCVQDETLLGILREKQPPFVFVCTGSGSQEKLGAWLKSHLDYRPAICCIGAAIAFESGVQARIPAWADSAGLGWLLRCLSDPSRYLPRYVKALELVYLGLRYRGSLPKHVTP